MGGSWQRLAFSLAGICVLLLAWSVAPADGIFLAPLGDVVQSFAALIETGALSRDVWDSFVRVASGVALGIAIASLLSVPSLFHPSYGSFFSGIVELFRPVPPIAWVPLFLVVFGIGDAPAVAIVAMGSFFPIWINLQAGIRSIEANHVLLAQSFQASRLTFLRHVLLPSVLPNMALGVRLGVGIGWFCVVAAEMMGVNSGLGYGVQLAALNIETGKMFSYIVTIGLCGSATNALLLYVESSIGWEGE